MARPIARMTVWVYTRVLRYVCVHPAVPAQALPLTSIQVASPLASLLDTLPAMTKMTVDLNARLFYFLGTEDPGEYGYDECQKHWSTFRSEVWERFDFVRPQHALAECNALPFRVGVDIARVFPPVSDGNYDAYHRWLEAIKWGNFGGVGGHHDPEKLFHQSDRIHMKQDAIPDVDSGEMVDEDLIRETSKKNNLRIVPPEDSNLVSSLTTSGMHKPIIDLDIPHVYVPSSTDGHGHLYLNVAMSHSDFETLLVTLNHYGIVGEGSVHQLRATGVALARTPDVRKPCRICKIVPEGDQRACQFAWSQGDDCMDPCRPDAREPYGIPVPENLQTPGQQYRYLQTLMQARWTDQSEAIEYIAPHLGEEEQNDQGNGSPRDDRGGIKRLWDRATGVEDD